MENLKYIQLDFLRLYRYGVKNNLIKKKFKTPVEYKTYYTQTECLERLFVHELKLILSKAIGEASAGLKNQRLP
jgi:hypothetical protein